MSQLAASDITRLSLTRFSVPEARESQKQAKIHFTERTFMFRINTYLCAGLLLICCALPVSAQQAAATATNAVVPTFTKFSGTLTDAKGVSLTSTVGVTFALYQNEQGGTALWVETQNVTPDKTGHYSVTLGSTTSQGLPANLFAAGEARWLGVQMQGQEEKPRVMLMSVPYALKALDAETIGGKPASSFMLAPAGHAPATAGNLPPGTITGAGAKNHVPRFTGATTIGNSDIVEASTGNVGIATGTPSNKLDVNGTGDFRDTVELFPTGSHPTLSVHGTAFAISHDGVVTFVSGQKFPGTGTISGVTAGTDLTGGGTSGNVTLNLDTTKVPQLGAANTFTANQSVNATMTATSFSGNGANLTNINAATLGGLAAGAFAQLGASNTFTGNTQLMPNFVIVGPITSFTEGQLAAGASDDFQVAFGAAGFTVPSGSNENGTDGIVTFGGSGDVSSGFASGGVGIFAEGGGGFNGSAGVSALGGGGGPCCVGSVDGPGGFFEGGSNSLNMGDGVDVLTGSGLAGSFSGSVTISADLNVGGSKNFKIDHPLDPANKYLVHSAVESSERMNIYTGNVTTDGRGDATVQLPEWFESENGDFRYQLTVIGQFAQAIVGKKIENHQFSISTNAAHVEVSWQVTAVRQDAYAKAHPLVVEEAKPTKLRGFYIHPELYGAPEEKQIEWARHPQLMKQAKERRSHPRQVTKGATLTQSLQPSK